jgi:integrase
MPAQITKRIGRRGKATWTVQLRIGKKANGRPEWLTATFEKQGLAKDFVRETLEDLKGGALVRPSELTLDAYLDHWLEAAAKGALRPNTYASYEESLNLYIRPELGRFQLDKLSPIVLQRHARVLTEQTVKAKPPKPPKTKGKAGAKAGATPPPAPPVTRKLSARTIRYAFGILKAALRQAVKWRILQLNPCDAVELPRLERREMRALDTEAARKFLAAAEGTRHEALFKLALATGMRPSEYLALRWKDVDLSRAVVSVQRALIRDASLPDGWALAETKTARSRRTIPVPAGVVEALRRHKARQAEERIKRGPAWQNHGLVFTNEIGGPLERQNILNRYFRPLLKAAGLPVTLRLYDLRHSAATMLLEAGVHPKVASERLGHASITMTLDTYSHVMPGMQRDASDKVEELLFGAEHSK